MTQRITYEQLIKEFVQAIEDIEYDERKERHTWTSREFRDEYSLSSARANQALDILVEKGILYRKKVWRVNDWGDKRHVPGYMLTQEFIPTQSQLES